MKPKDLKYPLSWEERAPLLHDGVLFVPKHYQGHQEWVRNHFNLSELTAGRPLHVEYCSGNGLWVIERALKSPDLYWIAVEKKFERVRKIWSKMHNLGVSNLLIVCGEAFEFSKNYLPDGCLEGIYVNFPDPWPKDKHAKHRLIQTPFAREISRCACPEATALIVTDHKEYTAQVLEQMAESWIPQYESPHYITEYPDYGTSFFDELFQKKGERIHYMKFGNAK